ncbi:MAG: cytochrome c3 family protein [Nitrospirae bacterium]|nr:cytochrome c3 family protein [Nitrospirota bacterium]MCL5238304.1 cytochrome c3 family protein [Nitrospirota bacterium]
MRNLFLSIIFLLAGLYMGVAYADSCVTDKCHSKIGKEKYVHGPVAVGECSVCHEKLGEHRFKPITNVKGLCAKCHDAKTGYHNASKAAANRDCGNCHDAHQSSRPQMLLVQKGKL